MPKLGFSDGLGGIPGESTGFESERNWNKPGHGSLSSGCLHIISAGPGSSLPFGKRTAGQCHCFLVQALSARETAYCVFGNGERIGLGTDH